jgi:hypothetical protein
VLDEIRKIYQQEAAIFPWQEGDVLMLDNMLAAHGRAPFAGSRKVVVGMLNLLVTKGLKREKLKSCNTPLSPKIKAFPYIPKNKSSSLSSPRTRRVGG